MTVLLISIVKPGTNKLTHLRNEAKGVLPKGVYDNKTLMYFCCRTDGDPDVPVELPRGRNFAFLKYGDRCQVA